MHGQGGKWSEELQSLFNNGLPDKAQGVYLFPIYSTENVFDKMQLPAAGTLSQKFGSMTESG